MYEENKKFNFASFFLKGIIVIIFILFTVWLLSLSNKGITKSLDVLTDEIFADNIQKMKEVGKEYFTTERLPKKVGDVEKLSLARMYDEKLILDLKDKNGNECSARNSYVSIEKYDTEYRMKVYLECGEQEDYIIVIMGCYDYCDTAICEKKTTATETPVSNLEYEYSKSTGGSWSDYGSWSEWSKTIVTKTDSRQVETKVVKEKYSYDKEVVNTVYKGDATCPSVSEYTLISNKNGKCSYQKVDTTKTDPVCPSVSGYTLTGRNGFTCSYTTSSTDTSDPVCPSVSGYTLTGRNGFTCSYSKTTSSTENPVCPSVSGYTYTGRSGFTCNYSKKISNSYNPVCPSVSGYTYTGRSGFTCNYKYSYKVAVGKKLVSTCTGCAKEWQTIYEWRTSYTTRTAYCNSGSPSGSYCVATSTDYTTRTATCNSGTKSGNTCLTTNTDYITKTATCNSGTKSGDTCVATNTKTLEKTATCKIGDPSGSICIKSNVSNIKKDAECPTDQEIKNGKCYKEETSTVTVTGTKEVTYYRYRTRSYIGGTTDYKWSTSNNDKTLIKQGYKLTGKTRTTK